MDNLRQRPGEHNFDSNSSDSNCFGSAAAAEDHHRPTSTMMTFHACRRRCTRIHPGSISNLCSATLGAGALSLPFAFSLTGIVFGILLLILSAYLTIVSIDVIIEACARTKLFRYEDVSVRLVGPSAGRVLEASLLVFCFGTAVAYIVAVGDILDQGLRSIPYLWESDTDSEENGWSFTSMYSRERIMICFWALVMFPLSLQRHVEALERFSSLGVLSIIFLVLSAVIHSSIHGDVIGKGDDSKQTYPTDISTMLWPKSFWDVMKAFPIIIFAFSCQVNVCEIYERLSPNDAPNSTSHEMPELKSKQRIMARITRNGVALCMTLYICIGLFGFLDFSYDTVDNILINYCIQTTHDALMIAASAFVAVAVVVAFPFNILPARVTLKLILERFRRRRRCSRCYRFFSGLTCSNCWCLWSGLKVQSNEDDATPIEVDDLTVSSPTAQYNGNEDGVTDPLLDDDRFGDRPYLVPHMSLEGLPIEGEEVYSTDSSPIEHFLLTLLLSGSALIVALLIPGISVIFGLMGGTAASIISFILPGMFLMEAYAGVTGEENNRSSKRMKLLGLSLVVGGSLIGVLSTGITIYDLFSPNDSVAVDTCGSA
mmetsp:Transcript_4169/g.7415  ORF Transcript_4169/g.7415 Transcript_4169/m.7415 type:complete len:599 (-) Transcript_4169:122-1918(-)